MYATIDLKSETFCGDDTEDPGGYIFQLADYIEPEEKISSENLYTKLHGIFIRQLRDGQKLAPSHEDLILFYTLTIIHPKLPAFIRDKYCSRIGTDKRILDFELEILRDAEEFVYQYQKEDDDETLAKKEQQYEEAFSQLEEYANNGVLNEQAIGLFEHVLKTELDDPDYDDLEDPGQEPEDPDYEQDEEEEEEVDIKSVKRVKQELDSDDFKYDPLRKRSKSDKKTLVECTDCDFTGTRKAVSNHIKHKHDGIRHPCDECDYTGTTKTALKKHKEVKHEGKTYHCGQCDFSSLYAQALRKHKNTVHNHIIHPCDACEYVANSIKQLERHKRVKHEGFRYTCDACEYVASDKATMNRHKRFTHLGAKHACNQCDFKTSKVVDLKRHKFAEHGDKSVKAQCEQCSRTFYSVTRLKDHVMVDHDGLSVSCDICEYSGSRRQVLSHKRAVHQQMYKCESCEYVGTSSLFLREHVESKHLGIRYNCDQCVTSFGSKRNLNRHIKVTHGAPEDRIVRVKNKDFRCDMCTFTTLVSEELKMHMESLHLVEALECDQCGFLTSKPEVLKTHTESKHKDETFLCDQCEYTTKRKRALKDHIEAVHLKKFFCEICNKYFSGKVKLDNHMQVKHSDCVDSKDIFKPRPKAVLMCDKCPYKTTWQGHLKNHVENNHGTQVFSCDLCDYKTMQPNEWKKHWGYRHDHSVKRYPCDQCHYSATFVHALKQHIQTIHEGIKFPCELCDYKAGKKADLLTHKKNIHERIRVPCEYCDATYSTACALRTHKKSKHPDLYIKYSRKNKV